MLSRTFETMGTVVSLSVKDDFLTQSGMDCLATGVRSVFTRLDNMFSTYRADSGISLFNAGLKGKKDMPAEFHWVIAESEKYRHQTDGYFDIMNPAGRMDPSGIVKAYAIEQAGEYLEESGVESWLINAGGDILASGTQWHTGIADPDNTGSLLSDVVLSDKYKALATSGYSERGYHIWNPMEATTTSGLIQVTVISGSIVESDVYATAIMAAGQEGMTWIEGLDDAEAMALTQDGQLLATKGYLALVPR